MRQVRLPTSKLVLVLLGLCFERHGELRLEEDEGWVTYRWRGPRGGNALVSVPADRPDLIATLGRVVSAPVAFVQLAGLLVALATHGDVEGGWAYERAAELLHGPRTRKSHRGREIPPLREWLGLMAEAWWRIDLEEPTEVGTARRKRGRGGARVQIDGPLISVEGSTVRLGRELAGALRSAMFVTVPATLFLVTRVDHVNPEGNLPSVAARARMRIGAAIAARWRQASGQRIRPQELFEQWAGLALEPVRRRRRLRSWTRALEEELAVTADGGGPRLGADSEWDELRPLRSLLRVLVDAGSAEGAVKAGRIRGPSG